VVSASQLLCALVAAARLAITSACGCTGAETRVRGIDLALSMVTRGIEVSSSGTHPGNGYTYDETASDRANQYNGRVYDPGTGFHDYGARMYWPQIGRFISADSYQGNIANPASLNRYSYVLNNPYRYVDPTGYAPHTVEELMDPGERWADKPTIEQRAAAQAAEWLAGQSLDETNPTGIRVAAAVAGAVVGLLDHEHMATTLSVAGSIRVNAPKGNQRIGNFDEARVEAFKRAGLTNPDEVVFSKMDPKTGTVVEFTGPGGAKVGYDGPHPSEGPSHDTQHISWQSAGKRGQGGERGNIPYSGPQHPSRGRPSEEKP
jgi:RHS repeat-associated protein